MRKFVSLLLSFAFLSYGASDPEVAKQKASFRQIGLESLLDSVGKNKIGVGEVALVILDSGAEGTHEDLSGRFVWGTPSDLDPLGHGTAVTGIAAAISDNARGITGISRQADVITIAVNKVNSNGQLYTDREEVFRAIASLRNLPYRLLVVNMSFSLDEKDEKEKKRWEDAFSALEDKALFVVGAGNYPGTNTKDLVPCSTSHLSNVMCVGGVDEQDSFFGSGSSQGREITVSAPWCGYTTKATPEGNAYGQKCGTSISTPFVSGALTLLTEEVLGENPYRKMSPALLKWAILRGSRFSPTLLGQAGLPGILDIATSLDILKKGVEEVSSPEVYGLAGWQGGTEEFTRGDYGVIWGKNLEECQVFLNGTPLEMISFPSDQMVIFKLPTSPIIFRQSGNMLALVKKDKNGKFVTETATILKENFSPKD